MEWENVEKSWKYLWEMEGVKKLEVSGNRRRGTNSLNLSFIIKANHTLAQYGAVHL